MESVKSVLMVMGSPSDLPIMQEASGILDSFGVGYDMKITSAHRTPDMAAKMAKNARKDGYRVIIAGAGFAAHLAGAFAAHSTLPVIGVPLANSALSGMDSLLSTVQMPGGIPVATVGLDKAGAKNAGLLAVQILSISDDSLIAQLDEYRKSMQEKVHEANEKLVLQRDS
jgi:phosphoribosylaminoimidazole carboxylase PurE protein